MRILLFIIFLIPLIAFANQECPANSTKSSWSFGESCSCNFGYEKNDNQCVKIDVPQNATLSIYGTWSCNIGFKRVEKRCEQVTLPDNASFTHGEYWQCHKGYKQNGNQCQMVKLPQNARFTIGPNWECVTGYVKSGESCREMTRNELVTQLNNLNELLLMQYMISAGKSCSAAFDKCEDECDDQFLYSSDERKCLEACEAGKKACE